MLIFCSILSFVTLSAQEKASEDFLSWSATRKLTTDDFHIKKGSATSSSFGQFSIGYSVKGFDFLNKNLNKRIFNHFIRTASWIDTTADLTIALKYQQTLFDISEVYARKFRQLLKANKKRMLMGLEFVHELESQIMSEFARRRLAYDEETKYATDAEKQKDWENQIQTELEQLKEFVKQ